MRQSLRRLFPALAVILLVVAGIAYLALREEAPAAGHSLGEVSRGDLVATVSATGTLNPLVTVLVGSQVSGTIESLSADFNSPVSRGDVIAQIDPALFRARVAQAEASLKSAEAARDRAWVSVLDARRNLARIAELQARQMVSESELDAARFAVDAAVVDHRVAGAAVAQATAALEHERLNLSNTTIHAPIDGVVISRDVDVGQTVAASLQAPTLFTIAQDLRQMQIETEVDEAFIGAIAEGQPVRFTVFAYPGRSFTGELSQVRLQPTVEAGVVKYNCIIHVDNQDLALKPGMTATVAIQVDERRDTLKVPNTALRFVPETLDAATLRALREELQSTQGIVWTPGAQGLEPRIVELGLAGEQETEIRGANIEAGMPVALPRRNDQRTGPRGIRLF